MRKPCNQAPGQAAPASSDPHPKEIADLRRAAELLRGEGEELAFIARINMMAEMVTGLAHELNQPLAAIGNYARGAVLRMERGTAEPADILHVLNRIAVQAERAGNVIRRLRTLVRRTPGTPETLDLNDVVRDSMPLLEIESRNNDCALHLELSERLPPVSGDAVQLLQVLVNLARNAFEAIPSDSNEREVVIRTRAGRSGAAEVSVSDSGPGLSTAQCEEVFVPFFTTKHKGVGVSLSVSRSIAEAHGGRLWATPNPGRGTTFHLSLPPTPPTFGVRRGNSYLTPMPVT